MQHRGSKAGNAFKGFVALKAVLQWLAASHAGVEIKYFPAFEEAHLGERLQTFCNNLVEKKKTVGDLFCALLRLCAKLKEGHDRHSCDPGSFFERLEEEIEMVDDLYYWNL